MALKDIYEQAKKMHLSKLKFDGGFMTLAVAKAKLNKYKDQ